MSWYNDKLQLFSDWYIDFDAWEVSIKGNIFITNYNSEESEIIFDNLYNLYQNHFFRFTNIYEVDIFVGKFYSEIIQIYHDYKNILARENFYSVNENWATNNEVLDESNKREYVSNGTTSFDEKDIYKLREKRFELAGIIQKKLIDFRKLLMDNPKTEEVE